MKAFWKKRVVTVGRPRPPAQSQEESSDSTISQFLTGDMRGRYSVKKLLAELTGISEHVASGRWDDLRELLVSVVDASIYRTRAGRGFLVMEEAGGCLRVEVARQHSREDLEGNPIFSRSAIRRVLGSGAPLRDAFHSKEEALNFGASVGSLELRSLMCVPFVVGHGEAGSQRGVLYVDSRREMFDERDLSYFMVLSQQIAVVLEFARLHVDSIEKLRNDQALELASAVQRGFMSDSPCGVPGFDVHGWYEPAGKASGDFYNCMCSGRGDMVALIGDATGHGIAPALVASSVQGSLRSLLRVLDDPAVALTTLNSDLAGRLEAGFFITLCLVVIGEDGSVRVLNAGHPDPLVWEHRTGRVRTVDTASPPALGIVPDFEYVATAPIQLDEGDALIVYTDGLSEARSSQDRRVLFGLERLCQALAEAAPRTTTAFDLSEAVAARALSFAGGRREDDMTIVAVRRQGIR